MTLKNLVVISFISWKKMNILEEDEYPGFSYSIGIEKCTGQPELIVTGLKQEIAHWMINGYNNRIKDGESFEQNCFYDDFLDGFKVTFKEVEKKHYKEYFGWGNWLYKNENFKVLQLIYPSTLGVWPWDEEATDDFTWFIPKLYAN